MKRMSVSKLTLCMVAVLMASLMLTSCDLGGVEQRDCVVIIGDSIFDLTGQIEQNLRQISGQKYRTYYMSATQMNGGVNDIESQFDRALRQGRIRTLIMDGGGNDYFFGGSLTLPNVFVNEVNSAYERIFRKAANGGVENIVVMGYYETGTTNATTTRSESEVRDLTLSAVQRYGGSLQKTVHFDPSDDAWFSSKRPSQYLLMDGIHPTGAASKRLAELIWQTMQENDIEQGEGCYY